MILQTVELPLCSTKIVTLCQQHYLHLYIAIDVQTISPSRKDAPRFRPLSPTLLRSSFRCRFDGRCTFLSLGFAQDNLIKTSPELKELFNTHYCVRRQILSTKNALTCQPWKLCLSFSCSQPLQTTVALLGNTNLESLTLNCAPKGW